MKLLAILTIALLFMSGFALAAPANEERADETDRSGIASVIGIATMKVMESETNRVVETGMYDYYQDGDDLILRKRPGRAKYGDITLKKGYRCGPDDCNDGDEDVRPEVKMNKAELIDAIASRSGLSKADSKKALDSFADSEVKALKKGDRIKFAGVGSFTSDHCKSFEETELKCEANIRDYLDADSDGDGIGDGTERGLDTKFTRVSTDVRSTRSPTANPDNWMDRCTPERCSPGIEGGPQTGKEIKIPAKNVVRGNGASGEMTIGEELNINLPNGRRIIREVGGKK